jgi:hypothetical protein
MFEASTPANTPPSAGQPQTKTAPTATPDAGQNGLITESFAAAIHIPA